jgi:hypothetical protein
MSVPGVRRAKAALSSGCKSHPATAPAGSDAWNSEAFDLVQDGPAPEFRGWQTGNVYALKAETGVRFP